MATNLQSASRAALNSDGPSILDAGAAVGGLLDNRNLEKVNQEVLNVLMDGGATIEEMESTLEKAKRAQNIHKKVQTVGEVSNISRGLTEAGNFFQGKIPDSGTFASGAVYSAAGPWSLASWAMDKAGAGDYDPLRYLAKGAGKVTGATVGKVVDPLIEGTNKLIRKVPGAVPTGKALSVTGGMPKTIFHTIKEAAKSPFSSTARESEYADRVAALKDYLRPLILNNQLTEDYQLGEIGYLRGLPEHGDMPSFQAASTFHDYKGMTVRELRQTPEGEAALADLSQEISGSQDVARIEAEENALMQDIMSTDPYTGETPMHNIKSYDDYVDLGIGTAYSDEHGTYDAMTGEPVDPLNPIRTQPAMPPASVTTPAPAQPALTPLERLAELRGVLDEAKASPIIKSTPIRKTQAGGPGPSRFFAPSQPAPKLETGPRRTFGSTSYDRRRFYGLTGGTRR